MRYQFCQKNSAFQGNWPNLCFKFEIAGYAIEQISTKITELRRRDAEYQAQYGMEYSAFSQRIAEDEDFVRQVESDINKMWESDLADWEFCYKGVEDWTRKLESILLT